MFSLGPLGDLSDQFVVDGMKKALKQVLHQQQGKKKASIAVKSALGHDHLMLDTTLNNTSNYHLHTWPYEDNRLTVVEPIEIMKANNSINLRVQSLSRNMSLLIPSQNRELQICPRNSARY